MYITTVKPKFGLEAPTSVKNECMGINKTNKSKEVPVANIALFRSRLLSKIASVQLLYSTIAINAHAWHTTTTSNMITHRVNSPVV